MLSELNKKELYSQILPYGLYYTSYKHKNVIDKRFSNLAKSFYTKEDFVVSVKSLMRFNDLQFLNDIKKLSEDKFIKELNVQYNFYQRSCSNMSEWLKHSDKLINDGLIFTGIDNKNLISIFIEWAEQKSIINTASPINKKNMLSSIFNKNNNAFEVCKELLEYLEITNDGVPNTKRGRIGKLTGLITAIKESPNMLKLDSLTDNQLLNYFNSHLNTSYKTFSKRNKDYKETIDVAKRFIKRHLRK